MFNSSFFSEQRRLIATYAEILDLLIIRTLHDCPSQMNENLLISNSKLPSDSESIWLL